MNFKLALASIVLSVSFGAQAELYRSQSTKVVQLLTHDTDFGGCMARLEESFTDISNGACGVWASFSCTNELLDENQSRTLWDAIQIAYATNKTVRVQVDSNKKHNGHCVAKRVDIQ